MSQRESSQLGIILRKSVDQQVWEQAERAVASEFGVDVDELSRPDVLRELSEAYLGRDALGRWRDDG